MVRFMIFVRVRVRVRVRARARARARVRARIMIFLILMSWVTFQVTVRVSVIIRAFPIFAHTHTRMHGPMQRNLYDLESLELTSAP